MAEPSPDLAGLERIALGREAEIFAWPGDRVLRLARDADAGARMPREAVALAVARAGGVPVPAVHESLTVGGRPGLVLDRVDGGDMLAGIASRPWTIGAAGVALGRLHARVHAQPAAGAGDLPSLREDLAARLDDERVPPDVRALALADLEKLPDGDRLCHGDFHPGNVLGGGSQRHVVDWTVSAIGDPGYDVARTRLVLRAGAVTEEAPAIARRLDGIGRPILGRAYWRAYRHARPVDAARVARWDRVCAAVRLTEAIPQERDALLAMAAAP